MEEHIIAFQKWFERSGGSLGSGIEISFDPQSGYHLRLPGGCELAAGSCIISCPQSLTISHLNSRQDGHSPWTCSEAFDWQGLCALSQLNFIRFFLIEQYQLKQSSFWWPYIQILPQPSAKDSFNTPLFYDEADTSWILGTGLGQGREQIEQLWRRQHSQGLHFHKFQEHSRYSWWVTSCSTHDQAF